MLAALHAVAEIPANDPRAIATVIDRLLSAGAAKPTIALPTNTGIFRDQYDIEEKKVHAIRDKHLSAFEVTF